MEHVHAPVTENTVWIGEAVPSSCGRHALQRNRILVLLLVSVAFVGGLTLCLRYGYEQTGDVEKLLATKACEKCNLSRTNLAGACLSRAHLRNASLRGADLSVADLSRADLRQADLSGASLYRANLSGADLRGANVTGVQLLFADLSGATWVDGSPCPVLPRR